MTPEQIIMKLAKRMGWQMIYPYGGQVAIALRFEPNGRNPVESSTAFPDWLNSRDALAPVMDTLTEEEWENLYIYMLGNPISPVHRSWATFFRTGLTLPPHDLARAIAEAIQDDGE